MNRYVIRFAKDGYLKYTSHLDLLRLFKRGFKKAGVPLDFSQGFNPHPKMVFAQPLSLGYTSQCELLEFETTQSINPEKVGEAMKEIMPMGITIQECKALNVPVKSLAAAVETVTYEVIFPIKQDQKNDKEKVIAYLSQEEIFAKKRQKKTKKMVDVEIRSKIRTIDLADSEQLTLNMTLDGGSASNLSPELVITTFMAHAGLEVERYDIEVNRKDIGFGNNLQF